jgi:hypothetical protein
MFSAKFTYLNANLNDGDNDDDDVANDLPAGPNREQRRQFNDAVTRRRLHKCRPAFRSVVDTVARLCGYSPLYGVRQMVRHMPVSVNNIGTALFNQYVA